jgi:hypothetical protein
MTVFSFGRNFELWCRQEKWKKKKEKKGPVRTLQRPFFLGKMCENALYFKDFEGKKKVESRHI